MSLPACDLILVRHGLTDWNEEGRLLGRSDIEINARGERQAAAVAEAIAGLEVAAVHSSPQRRTVQTAEHIARPHGLETRIEPRLDEVWLGRWKGHTVKELRGDPDLESYLRDPLHVCDAIEPAHAVRDRVVAFVEKLREEAGGAVRHVLVSHGDPLRLLLAHYLHMEIASFRRLTVGNGSLSLLRFTARGPRVLALNWRGASEALAEVLA